MKSLGMSVSVAPINSVHDLGILLNSDMSMDAHLTRLVSSCFGVLKTNTLRPPLAPTRGTIDVSYVVHHVQGRQL